MTNWSDILDSTATAEQIKNDLPVAYVLEVNGSTLEQKGSVQATVCPFHDDSDPSLEVFGEHGDRWKCFPATQAATCSTSSAGSTASRRSASR